MKHFSLMMIFAGWFLLTAIATLTVVGLLILYATDEWFEVPGRLIDKM